MPLHSLFRGSPKPRQKSFLQSTQLALFFFFSLILFVTFSLYLYSTSLPDTLEIPKDYFPLDYEQTCFEKGGSFQFLQSLSISSIQKMEEGTTPKLFIELSAPDGRTFKGVWKPFLTKAGFAPMDLLSYHLACYFQLRSTPPSFYMEIPQEIYLQHGLEVIRKDQLILPGVFISWVDGLSRAPWGKVHFKKFLEPVLGWCSSSFSCRSALGLQDIFDFMIGNWDRFYNQHSIWWTDDEGKMKQSLILLDHNHCKFENTASLPQLSHDCSILSPFFSQLCNKCSDMIFALLDSLATSDPNFLLFLRRKEGIATSFRIEQFLKTLQRKCFRLCSMRQDNCDLSLVPDWKESWTQKYPNFFLEAL